MAFEINEAAEVSEEAVQKKDGEHQMKMVLKDGKVYRLGKRQYANGDIYTGEFFKGKREGVGRLECANKGGTYFGDWEKNLYHGKGTYVSGDFSLSADGSRGSGYRYEGEYRKGAKDGKGLEHCRNGDIYQGSFQCNLYHGLGRLRRANGDIFVGDFSKGRISGKCKIEYSNGDQYFGQVEAGALHGEGFFHYKAPGGSYKGKYEYGVQHGDGIRIFADGSVYTGSFVNGHMSGEGSLRRTSGACYVGSFQMDMPHGRGVMVYKNGDRFEGFLYQGIFCGRGKYTYADGSYYDGEYSAADAKSGQCNSALRPTGKRSGLGTRLWLNGNSYVGEWRDNKMNGHGTYTQASTENIYTGTFKDDYKDGYGEERWGNQLGLKFRCGLQFGHSCQGFCRYRGEYSRNQFHGQGIHTCVDGREYNGEWRYGMRHGYGSMILCPVKERGNPKRRFIGGVDGLYRAYSYEGPWQHNERHGDNGTLTMCDGTIYKGTFLRGQLHGQVAVFFAQDKNSSPEINTPAKMALYKHGQRVYWLDEAPGSPKAALKKLTRITRRCLDAIHHAREEESFLRAQERKEKRIAYEARKQKAKERAEKEAWLQSKKETEYIQLQPLDSLSSNISSSSLKDHRQQLLRHTNNNNQIEEEKEPAATTAWPHDTSIAQDTQPTCALPLPRARDEDSSSSLITALTLQGASILTSASPKIVLKSKVLE